MRAFIAVLLCCIAAVTGDPTPTPAWSNLKASFLIGKENAFGPLPRTIREFSLAQFRDQNWVPTSSTPNDCTNGGLFNGVQYVRSNDYSVGLLYDKNGVIAGIQMLIPHAVVLTQNNNLRYSEIPMYNNATYAGQNYFVLTAYVVDPSTICSTGRVDSALQTQGTGSGLWIQNGPSAATVIQVPQTRPAADSGSEWTENNCFIAMGAHNFHKLPEYTETNCTKMSPVFGLYNKGTKDLHGLGFITVGNVDNPRFEHPPQTAIKMILGNDKTPQCVLDIEASVGVTSIHIWFIESPQTIGCEFVQTVTQYISNAAQSVKDTATSWWNRITG